MCSYVELFRIYNPRMEKPINRNLPATYMKISCNNGIVKIELKLILDMLITK